MKTHLLNFAMQISPLRLRQLWSLVEAIQAPLLVKLDERELVDCLMARLEAEQCLDSGESDSVRVYIHSRIQLIRDLAQTRLNVDLMTS
ncbi:hypothetical protein [Lusitaniella coriacea]|uniref:hypothetical protein n=1 Tax=Lusitaniella coriacea TaxID=1983105 RepID=UPI001D13FDAC|nr:hypothetical protein [Lusitaniella coriacea]